MEKGTPGLIDQGSSADVMFWSTFNKLQLSPDRLFVWFCRQLGGSKGTCGVKDNINNFYSINNIYNI